MPLQLREMRLFAKGQVLEEEVVAKLVSSLTLSPPPSPPTPTPPTKPGGALYGLDFTARAGGGARDAGPPQGDKEAAPRSARRGRVKGNFVCRVGHGAWDVPAGASDNRLRARYSRLLTHDRRLGRGGGG